MHDLLTLVEPKVQCSDAEIAVSIQSKWWEDVVSHLAYSIRKLQEDLEGGCTPAEAVEYVGMCKAYRTVLNMPKLLSDLREVQLSEVETKEQEDGQ